MEFDALVLRTREGLPTQHYPEGFLPFDSWRSSKEIERDELDQFEVRSLFGTGGAQGSTQAADTEAST